ncbi:MAG TPA: transglutaminase-like domain-containing protein [Candidatus Woesearchaeota archaeon]|jgi:transglutaminase-like putative cysteine protease|nr:transglutaminase-like domain-containing protein [Candidatus Woesearchaeota archaeon]|tara:strand:+ start:25758 stop:27830 length:2073 start_codon:yes stop_codon:yes gene_type:complete
MKIFPLFLAFILLFSNLTYAQDNWFYNSQNLVISINLSSEAKIIPTSLDYNVNYITVNLSHYPYDADNQKVFDFNIKPNAEKENNALLFEWQNPKDRISFGYETRIKTSSNIIKIKEKVPFPIINLPNELKQFTEPKEIIDSDSDDIIRLASKLAEGEDDLYIVVHKIAEWTKDNIEYNLSTLTADVSQKASWILENRQGVCDELTSLFIAMLRSLGIPAKFISGIAYTNSELFPENWGSHGWAEVYFPGYGWIPYDVTYGQFGYIDPTHVKMKESVDSNEASVQYKWVSRNIELETKDLDIDASLEDKSGRAKNHISFNADILKKNIGFDSYNLVEAVLENLEDYYVSLEIYLSKPIEVEITGDPSKNILLKPNERKSVFWITKLTKELQNNFIYTFPLTIYSLGDAAADASFKSTKGDIVYSFDEINSALKQKIEEDEKTYSRDIKINCSIDKNEFYSYESALLSCKIRNIGNIFLESLDVCFIEKCKEIDLGITQEKSLNFSVENLKEEKKEFVLSAKNAEVSKAEYIKFDVLDRPEIRIKNINAPNQISYDDNFKVEFLLNKESRSNPQNIEIIFMQNGFEKVFYLDELFQDRSLAINLLGKNLKKGINEFNIITKYEDKNQKKYETAENFSIDLINVTLIQNIYLTTNNFLLVLENLTPRSLLLVVIGAIFVFIAMLWVIFRKRN